MGVIMRYNTLMIFELFRWWYGTGWQKIIHGIVRAPAAVEENFSVGILLGTLFAPWKRMVSAQGRSLDQKVQAMLDNLISRFVGFFVRFFVLIAAAVGILVAFIGSAMLTVVWPLVPPFIVYCIARGIVG